MTKCPGISVLKSVHNLLAIKSIKSSNAKNCKALQQKKVFICKKISVKCLTTVSWGLLGALRDSTGILATPGAF